MRRRTAMINAALALTLVGTVAGGYLAIGNPSAAPAAASQTTRVTRGDVTSTVTASGNSASAKTRDVAFDGSGTISAIYVKAGARVVREPSWHAWIRPTPTRRYARHALHWLPLRLPSLRRLRGRLARSGRVLLHNSTPRRSASTTPATRSPRRESRTTSTRRSRTRWSLPR